LPGRRESILIVEDCSLSRKLARELFDSEGFRVREASTGGEALAELARGRADLVLVDLRLPDMHGFELARRIRRDPSAQDLLILATSAAPDVREDDARDAGCDGFVPKPIEIEAIEAHLAGIRTPAARPAASPSEDVEASVRRRAGKLGMKGSDPWLERFLDRCRRDLDALRRAAAQEDAGALREISHRLAGASGMIGGARVARCCLDLERLAGGGGRGPDVAGALGRLEEELNSLRAAIVAFARVEDRSTERDPSTRIHRGGKVQ